MRFLLITNCHKEEVRSREVRALERDDAEVDKAYAAFRRHGDLEVFAGLGMQVRPLGSNEGVHVVDEHELCGALIGLVTAEDGDTQRDLHIRAENRGPAFADVERWFPCWSAFADLGWHRFRGADYVDEEDGNVWESRAYKAPDGGIWQVPFCNGKPSNALGGLVRLTRCLPVRRTVVEYVDLTASEGGDGGPFAEAGWRRTRELMESAVAKVFPKDMVGEDVQRRARELLEVLADDLMPGARHIEYDTRDLEVRLSDNWMTVVLRAGGIPRAETIDEATARFERLVER